MEPELPPEEELDDRITVEVRNGVPVYSTIIHGAVFEGTLEEVQQALIRAEWD